MEDLARALSLVLREDTAVDLPAATPDELRRQMRDHETRAALHRDRHAALAKLADERRRAGDHHGAQEFMRQAQGHLRQAQDHHRIHTNLKTAVGPEPASRPPMHAQAMPVFHAPRAVGGSAWGAGSPPPPRSSLARVHAAVPATPAQIPPTRTFQAVPQIPPTRSFPAVPVASAAPTEPHRPAAQAPTAPDPGGQAPSAIKGLVGSPLGAKIGRAALHGVGQAALAKGYRHGSVGWAALGHAINKFLEPDAEHAAHGGDAAPMKPTAEPPPAIRSPTMAGPAMPAAPMSPPHVMEPSPQRQNPLLHVVAGGKKGKKKPPPQAPSPWLADVRY